VKYYLNPKTGEIRVATKIGEGNAFVVVKLFDDDKFTIKFWHNATLESTASYWNTKAFEPNPDQLYRILRRLEVALDSAYHDLVRIPFFKWKFKH
jgi:hypothetical protein